MFAVYFITQVHVSQLQETPEVSTGFDSLQGYELYDLVMLGPNEVGVICRVNREVHTCIRLGGVRHPDAHPVLLLNFLLYGGVRHPDTHAVLSAVWGTAAPLCACRTSQSCPA